MILVFGSLNMDIVVPVPALPKAGETVLSPSYLTAPGGKGSNQAVAAARAGAEVALVGCVGRDPYGDTLLEIVSAEGIDSRAIDHVELPTGVAVVAVADDGENQIIVCVGANGAAREDQVSDAMLDAASTVLLQMEVPLREVFTFADRAKRAGRRVILNTAPAGPIMPETVDVVIMNEGEACQVAHAIGLDESEPSAIARRLAASHGLTVVTTLGGAGAAAVTPEGGWRVGALPIAPRDTTGAGDAFCGVFAASLDRGDGLDTALRRASVAGSLACLTPGAMPSLPRRETIETHLANLAPALPF